MLDLDPSRVDLWFAFYTDIRDERLLTEYRRLLTDQERAQAVRFHFAKDQHRYLITRALARTVLSRYAPIAPQDWRFCANAHGRPEIVNDPAIATRITFNISHSQGVIVLGVTSGQALGVDVENVQVRKISLDIADRFFSPREVADLHATPTQDQHERFFHYWTLKESYIKARGLGLSIPLDQFGFYFPQDSRVAFSIEPRLQDTASRWRFWQLRPSPDFLAAVCVERTQSASPRLIMRTIVPLSAEAMVDYPPLRTSE